MQFCALPGCQKEKDYLRRIVQAGKIPHAQLFVDKTASLALPLARAFLRYLYCTARTPDDACGQCDDCLKMNKLSHPDLAFIFPSPSSARKEKNQNSQIAWRSFLTEKPHGNLEDWSSYLGNETKSLQIRREQIEQLRTIIAKKSFLGRSKTFLVFLPETANTVAANAMLKMVEEPTPDTYFIFISYKPTQILPTLYSRMWHLTMPKLSETDIHTLLTRNYPKKHTEELQKIALLARGDLNLAYRLVDGDEKNIYFENCSKWLRAAYLHNWNALDERSETFHTLHGQHQKSWLHYAMNLCRLTLYASCHANLPKVLTSEEKQFIHRLAETLNVEEIQSILNHLAKLQKVLERNAYARLAFMSCSLKIATTFRALKR